MLCEGLKAVEISPDGVDNVTVCVTRTANSPMTHFNIEVRSLCKGVSKILTAYRI